MRAVPGPGSLAGYATSTQTINLTQSTTAQFSTVQRHCGYGQCADEPFRDGPRVGEHHSVVDRQRLQRDFLHGGAVRWHDAGDWTSSPATCRHGHDYTDNNVTAGSSYSYEVAAFDGTIESPDSNVALATVPSATPAAPSNLVAMAAALPASVSLSWTDNDPNATSYVVERSDGTTGDWTVIASNLAATATSYTDSNVTAGASYSYQVEAFDGTAGRLTPTWRRPRCPTRPRRPRAIFRPWPPPCRPVSACRGPTTPQRDLLHGGAVRRHDGRLDRHRQQSRRHGHQLHGQQRDGRGELQLPGRGI